MAKPGSYDWWRSNYKTNGEYQQVSTVLSKLTIDCTAVEVDHFPPNASYVGTIYNNQLSYGARPALPLPKYLHRFHRGDGGMGGHASTTGSTFVAKGWTGSLKVSMASGQFYDAMRQDLIDKQNIAYYYAQDRNLFDALMVPAIQLAFEEGLITQGEALEIHVNCFGSRFLG